LKTLVLDTAWRPPGILPRPSLPQHGAGVIVFSRASFNIGLALLHDAPLLTAERTTTPWVVRLGEHVQSVRA
jgi:hypothetical protein